MDYFELIFSFSPDSSLAREVLSALLADLGCESFSETDETLKAYIPAPMPDPTLINQLLDAFPLAGVKINWTASKIERRDWNEEWEKNYFQPVIIADKAVIHSSFHKNVPKMQYDIVIDPRMAFGTGNHATTSMMAAFVLETELEGKSALDMGCGTAVLAILAKMRGARRVLAIDNDRWAWENAIENVRLNSTPDVEVLLGDATTLTHERFDMIFANINRNILLNDIPKYATCLESQGSLFVSGILCRDKEIIVEKCHSCGLTPVAEKKNGEWIAIHFTLNPK
jgi:ribosomal protein L11 methyltransferase